jgi:hypothetical protein
MNNKFLEKYPELWEPKVGDRVRMIGNRYPNHYTGSNLIDVWIDGDIGVIISITKYRILKEYKINFKNKITQWWVVRSNFEIISHE